MTVHLFDARVDLPAMVRRSNRRNRQSIVLRSIDVTKVLEDELLKLIVRPLNEWWKQLNEVVLPSYHAAMDLLTRDAADDPVRQALEVATSATGNTVLSLSPDMQAYLERMQKWHSTQWGHAVKSGTGIDVFPFIDHQANATELRAMQDRITGLVTGMNDEARKNIEETVWKGFLDKTPRVTLGALLMERLGVSRSRANLIASDQANKVSAELTRIRQLEAGIDKFMWETSKDDRVRPEHAALQGKVYEWGSPPSIGLPGTPIRCRCTGRAYIDLEAEAAEVIAGGALRVGSAVAAGALGVAKFTAKAGASIAAVALARQAAQEIYERVAAAYAKATEKEAWHRQKEQQQQSHLRDLVVAGAAAEVVKAAKDAVVTAAAELKAAKDAKVKAKIAATNAEKMLGLLDERVNKALELPRTDFEKINAIAASWAGKIAADPSHAVSLWNKAKKDLNAALAQIAKAAGQGEGKFVLPTGEHVAKLGSFGVENGSEYIVKGVRYNNLTYVALHHDDAFQALLKAEMKKGGYKTTDELQIAHPEIEENVVFGIVEDDKFEAFDLDDEEQVFFPPTFRVPPEAATGPDFAIALGYDDWKELHGQFVLLQPDTGGADYTKAFKEWKKTGLLPMGMRKKKPDPAKVLPSLVPPSVVDNGLNEFYNQLGLMNYSDLAAKFPQVLLNEGGSFFAPGGMGESLEDWLSTKPTMTKLLAAWEHWKNTGELPAWGMKGGPDLPPDSATGQEMAVALGYGHVTELTNAYAYAQIPLHDYYAAFHHWKATGELPLQFMVTKKAGAPLPAAAVPDNFAGLLGYSTGAFKKEFGFFPGQLEFEKTHGAPGVFAGDPNFELLKQHYEIWKGTGDLNLTFKKSGVVLPAPVKPAVKPPADATMKEFAEAMGYEHSYKGQQELQEAYVKSGVSLWGPKLSGDFDHWKQTGELPLLQPFAGGGGVSMLPVGLAPNAKVAALLKASTPPVNPTPKKFETALGWPEGEFSKVFKADATDMVFEDIDDLIASLNLVDADEIDDLVSMQKDVQAAYFGWVQAGKLNEGFLAVTHGVTPDIPATLPENFFFGKTATMLDPWHARWFPADKDVAVKHREKIDAERITLLTAQENSVLENYRGVGSKRINRAAREGNAIPEHLHMDVAATRWQLPHDVLIYRGTPEVAGINTIQDALDRKGAVINDPAWQSSSFRRTVSESFMGDIKGKNKPPRVLFVIRAKEGQRVGPGTMSEQEYIFPRNTEWSVLDVEVVDWHTVRFLVEPTPEVMARDLGKPVESMFEETVEQGKLITAPKMILNKTLTYHSDARHTGGMHTKEFWQDEFGDKWLFKPEGSALTSYVPHAEELASKIGSQIGRVFKVYTIELNGKFGSIQKWEEGSKSFQMDWNSTSDVAALQQEHVINWLISNHDANPKNFIRLASGQPMGIDKAQAFKFMGRDKLSTSYSPNPSEPIFNDLWKRVAAGTVDVDLDYTWDAIAAIEKVSDVEYVSWLMPYAEALFDPKKKASTRLQGSKQTPAGMQTFLNTALMRKKNLRQEFEAFFIDLGIMKKPLGKGMKDPKVELAKIVAAHKPPTVLKLGKGFKDPEEAKAELAAEIAAAAQGKVLPPKPKVTAKVFGVLPGAAGKAFVKNLAVTTPGTGTLPAHIKALGLPNIPQAIKAFVKAAGYADESDFAMDWQFWPIELDFVAPTATALAQPKYHSLKATFEHWGKTGELVGWMMKGGQKVHTSSSTLTMNPNLMEALGFETQKKQYVEELLANASFEFLAEYKTTAQSFAAHAPKTVKAIFEGGKATTAFTNVVKGYEDWFFTSKLPWFAKKIDTPAPSVLSFVNAPSPDADSPVEFAEALGYEFDGPYVEFLDIHGFAPDDVDQNNLTDLMGSDTLSPEQWENMQDFQAAWLHWKKTGEMDPEWLPTNNGVDVTAHMTPMAFFKELGWTSTDNFQSYYGFLPEDIEGDISDLVEKDNAEAFKAAYLEWKATGKLDPDSEWKAPELDEDEEDYEGRGEGPQVEYFALGEAQGGPGWYVVTQIGHILGPYDTEAEADKVVEEW